MALMISGSAAFHWVERISAEHNTKGALKIVLHGAHNPEADQFNIAEVMIFTENADMCDRLVAAINAVLP